MGCDIHWYSEHLEGNSWVCDQASSFDEKETGCDYSPPPDMDEFPNSYRDYLFFGLLSNGVRTSWEYSFDPKGEPYDCSEQVQRLLHYWGEDGHSHSYLTCQELEDKVQALELLQAEILIAPRNPEELTPDDVAYHIHRLKTVITDLKALRPNAHPQTQRIVFWFDN